MSLRWIRRPAAAINEKSRARARDRQRRLTKPEGSLGALEVIAVRLAGMQGVHRPGAERVHAVVFAADHGVAEEGVSAFPESVTRQMLGNIAGGGAAVSVLAACNGVRLQVVDVGVAGEGASPPGVLNARAGPGTANFTLEPAMTAAGLGTALDAGRAAAARARGAGAALFVGGEMGIGNTTSATAIACALLGEAPADLAGPGTGLDPRGVERKARVIGRGLERHRDYLSDPVEIMRRLGGFEIAAMSAAFCACAQNGLPVLVDGFIAGVAALWSSRLCSGAGEWFLFAHRSAEPGHAKVLRAMGAEPLLDLGMRLGEGSGALVALPLIRFACALHDGMATFEEAGVATGNN